MLEIIKGKLAGKFENYVILENIGLGLAVFALKRDLLKMPKINSFVKLYTHLSVSLRQREIEMLIFGFLEKSDRDFFRELLKKDRIGVKIAFLILNFASAYQIKQALKKGDFDFFNNCKGVPKKIIKSMFLDEGFLPEKKQKKEVSIQDKKIIEALKKLGYQAKEAKEALSQVPEKIKETEKRLKQALKILSQ